MASIWKLGLRPCPQCLIPLNRMANMGMPQDMKERMTRARADDARRRNLIKNAREIIYVKNYMVDSKAVERILKDESLVPMMVCDLYLCGTGADIVLRQNAS